MRHTENYQLPIYEPNDVTSYLNTYDQTMELIDAGMFKNATDIIKNSQDITNLEKQMTTANDEINELTGEVSDLKTASSGHESRLNGIDQQISALQNEDTTIKEELENVGDFAGQSYSGTLSANETTLAVQIGNFDSNTLVDVYTNVYAVQPKTATLRAATGGTPNVCVMTFDPLGYDLNVVVVTRQPSPKPATVNLND